MHLRGKGSPLVRHPKSINKIPMTKAAERTSNISVARSLSVLGAHNAFFTKKKEVPSLCQKIWKYTTSGMETPWHIDSGVHRLFVQTGDGGLEVLNEQGEPQWIIASDPMIASSVLIDSEEKVTFIKETGEIFKYSAMGDVIYYNQLPFNALSARHHGPFNQWTFDLHQSKADDTIFLGRLHEYGSSVGGINPANGKLDWRVVLERDRCVTFREVALTKDKGSVLYVGVGDHNEASARVYEVSTDGMIDNVLTFPSGNLMCLGQENDTLYFWAGDNSVFAWDVASKEIKWQRSLEKPLFYLSQWAKDVAYNLSSSLQEWVRPVRCGWDMDLKRKTLYCALIGQLNAIDANNGRLKWILPLAHLGAPKVAANGDVLIHEHGYDVTSHSMLAQLLVIDPAGTVKWKEKTSLDKIVTHPSKNQFWLYGSRNRIKAFELRTDLLSSFNKNQISEPNRVQRFSK